MFRTTVPQAGWPRVPLPLKIVCVFVSILGSVASPTEFTRLLSTEDDRETLIEFPPVILSPKPATTHGFARSSTPNQPTEDSGRRYSTHYLVCSKDLSYRKQSRERDFAGRGECSTDRKLLIQYFTYASGLCYPDHKDDGRVPSVRALDWAPKSEQRPPEPIGCRSSLVT